MKKNIVLIVLVSLLLITAGIFYFLFPVIVMPDSTEYFGYLKILKGQEDISTWNVVRGPSFPIVLFLITSLFGNSQTGLLIGTFIFYLLTVLVSYFLFRKIHFQNIQSKRAASCVFLFLVVLNPMLIGYMHGLLTEFFSIPILTIFSLTTMKWLKKDNTIWVNIFLTIILILGCVFMWLLKQPYVFLAFAPVIVGSIISIFENKKIVNVLYRGCITLLCMFSILIGNHLWNQFLIQKEVDFSSERGTDSFIKTAIINGNTAFSIDFYEHHYEEEYIVNSNLIKELDKEEIIKVLKKESTYKSFKLVNVFYDFRSREESNIEEKLVMFSKSDKYTIPDSIKMYLKLVTKYPGKTIQSYCLNYLAISDFITSQRHADGNEYYPSLSSHKYYENMSIGYAPYRTQNSMLWVNETHYLYENVQNLDVPNHAPTILKKLVEKTFIIYNVIYMICMIILPMILIGLIKKIKQAGETYKQTTYLGIILIGSSLIHILLHTITGAIIDRYAFVAFPSILLGFMIYIFEPRNKEEERQMLEKLPIIENPKTLIVIPAHNEAENIQKVIDEIKRDFFEADVLILNDASTDNTREIVLKNQIPCIDTVFNLRYAYTVQTGIKYAKQNNYDYVIQFDGDGQHIASEAKRLLNAIREKNCDIVIGSRYLEKGNYEPAFFRNLGTKIFSFFIKLFCKKKITDPLSGFQILNKRVIDQYAKIGKYPEYPDANLIIEMILKGYEIEEISVKMRLREFGESMHGGIIKPIKYMIVMGYTVFIIIINNLFRRRK